VAAAEALSLAHPKAITILDAGSVKPLVQPWIPQLSVVAASADYAAALDLTPDQAVDDLIAQGTRAALVTTGPGPVRWRTAYGSSGVVQPPQVRAVDTLGAGDAFHGALLAALVQSPSLSSDFGYAVERAVRVASLRVAHVSAPNAPSTASSMEFLRELNFGTEGVPLARSTVNDQYLALARTVRHYLMADWLETARKRRESPPAKMVGYLSAEYLLGRQLGNALLATDLTRHRRGGLASCGIDLATLRAQEVEPGLGNGGLGRLAACFIDSLATMDVSLHRLRHPLRVRHLPPDLRRRPPGRGARLVALPRRPWEFPQPERAVQVDFGGHTEEYVDEDGRTAPAGCRPGTSWASPTTTWSPATATAWSTPCGCGAPRPPGPSTWQIFNSGDYAEAVRAQTFAENISKVLYPEDSTPQGRELRLQQQYFFVACSLQDYIQGTLPADFDLHDLPERIIFQLNDTHPVIAVPELMRLLVDEHDLEWDEAWEITQRCFAYTCHTLLPEALEVWPTDLLGEAAAAPPGDHLPDQRAVPAPRSARPSPATRCGCAGCRSSPTTRSAVRMAHLATVASPRSTASPSCTRSCCATRCCPTSPSCGRRSSPMSPTGSPRAASSSCQPALSDVITDTIGDGWVTDLDGSSPRAVCRGPELSGPRSGPVKAANKDRLHSLLEAATASSCPRVTCSTSWSSGCTSTSARCSRCCTSSRPTRGSSPARSTRCRSPRARDVRREGGARLLHGQGDHLPHQRGGLDDQRRPAGQRRLVVAFPANYNVTLAEKIIPAADLSEQISLAGKEASGTGNMKFALNGALTIGTDDGANVEIRRLVGDDNFFLFGMSEPEVAALQAKGYVPGVLLRVQPDAAARARPHRQRGVHRWQPAGRQPDHRRPARATTASSSWPTTSPTSTPRPGRRGIRETDDRK
jgi:starch phosphorylase